jgi:hypothetical protein
MKPYLMLLACFVIIVSACKKNKQINKEPQAIAYKYSKIESFYTPVENGTPIPTKRKPYTERQFDDNGNLTKLIYRPYAENPAESEEIINTFKYENNKRVEQITGDVRFSCTYNSSGDTLELKHYLKNALLRRSVYAYGSNGKKSTVTYYDLVTAAAIEKITYAYNNLNLLVREQYISLVPEESISQSIIYTYNSSGNITRMENEIPSLSLSWEFSYVYNDKGWIMESVSIWRDVAPFKHNYTYDADGQVIKDHYSYPDHYSDQGKQAIIDYVYITR